MPRLVWKMPKRLVLLCDDVTGIWTFCDICQKLIHYNRGEVGAFGSFLYVFVDCLRNFLWSRTFISGESKDLGVRTVWKRVMEVGSIILRIYGSNMNSLFSLGYPLKCRWWWWWWWFQRYVQSHRLEKDVFFQCFLTKLPSDANSGAGRISQDIHMEKLHGPWGTKAHICTN